eukprot:scaffold45987_cov32-Attheya_sp.AAC.4
MVAELAKLTISVGLLLKLRVLCLWRRGGGNVGTGGSFTVVVGVGPVGRRTMLQAGRVAEMFSADSLMACFASLARGVVVCSSTRTIGGDTLGTAGSGTRLILMGTLGSAALPVTELLELVR